ncbi:helix-turn-helix domain-containing protein [Microbacterium sp. NPDC089695]|uniref:helix-turn-helix domain-containing protein n=1 Tax=Microbacterium sp. NPDC089695 TaxID=3364198 RepID=UPI00382F21A7
MPSATPKQLAQRKAFGARVRQLRLAAGLSQEELAHRAELDRSYVGQVERGERNISLDNIYRLADAVQCSPVDLFVR